MKATVKLMTFLAGISLLASCAKEQNVPVDIPSDKQEWDASKYLTSFGVSVEEVTKADINTSTGAVTWNTGDKVLVYEPTGGSSAEYQWDGSGFVPVSTPVEVTDGLAYAYFPAEFFTVDAGTVSITIPSWRVSCPPDRLPAAHPRVPACSSSWVRWFG